MDPARRTVYEPNEKESVTVGTWLFLAACCAFSFGFLALSVLHNEHPLAITMAALFSLVSVVGIVVMTRLTLSRARFGEVSLVVEGEPAVGGKVRARLDLAQAATPAPALKASLRCGRVLGAHKGGSVLPLWGDERSFAAGAEVPSAIEFALPDGLPATDHGGQWELKVTAEVSGVDLVGTFRIDVHPAPPEQPKSAVPPPIPMTLLPEPEPALSGAGDTRPSVAILVAANLLPLAGVILWQWSVRDLIFLYWMENVVIGMFNVLRIATSRPDDAVRRGLPAPGSAAGIIGKLVFAAFFIVHFGGFCYLHGEFLGSMFDGPGARFGGLTATVIDQLREPPVRWALLGIVASHAFSYVFNYIGKGEYRRPSAWRLMLQPYLRIGVTQIFLLAGGFVMLALRSPVAGMALFVAVKIAFDVFFHRREHAPG